MPTLLHAYTHVKGPAHVAIFNAGGSYILSGGQDRSIKLVNAESGAIINTYSGHGYEVLSLAVAHDNSRFASCGGDRSALYWDVPSSTIIKRFSGHTGRINSVAFNSESSVLASASFDATVRLWDLRSQQARPIQVLQEARDSVTCVFIGDREIIASSVDGHVRTYDLRMGQLQADFFDQPITSVSLTKDAQTMLVTTLGSALHLMDRQDGSELQRYDGHKNASYRIHSCFGAGEASILTGDEEGKLWKWDLTDGKHVLLSLKIAEKSLLWVEQYPGNDKDIFVTAGSDGQPSKLDTARRQRQCFSRGKNVLLHHIRLTKSSNHRSGSAMQAISMFQMEIGVDSGLISEAVLKRITTLRLARVGLLGDRLPYFINTANQRMLESWQARTRTIPECHRKEVQSLTS
ncbi:MAG: hypothetical protein CYPHOPRED_002040 [Cyphobasidiales sp. Tagirdzhanova-0007]|nr:MAG: hypothetical protein CYPHOPRED_002040 [Cyphobasidiales sp. Tagirdzhanova-0007]